MDVETNSYLHTLAKIVSIPTASFYEHGVLSTIKIYLEELGINYYVDKWGNIIAHYQKGENIPPLVLVAHTDHPALELVQKETCPEFPAANYTARLLGGVKPECFDQEVPVKLYRRGKSSNPVIARILGYNIIRKPSPEINFFMAVDSDEVVPGEVFGVWDLPDFEVSDSLFHARVIDDLVGCASILLVFSKLVQEFASANLYGVFTRAEEVGLVGADMVFQSGVLPPESLVVSIEASKALPGAVQGEGPVIRAGDRAFTFDEDAEFVLRKAALKLGCDLASRTPQPVKIQRQLMTGGRCEAGSAILNGYKTTGLAFPLGNYHNVSDAPAEPSYLATENIHVQDFITGVDLLHQAALIMSEIEMLREEQRVKEIKDTTLTSRLEATANWSREI
jgi:endoglucanase